MRNKWWVREIERLNREHAAERAELVAAIAHLSGRPFRQEPVERVEPEPRATVRNLEQYPDNYDLADV